MEVDDSRVLNRPEHHQIHIVGRLEDQLQLLAGMCANEVLDPATIQGHFGSVLEHILRAATIYLCILLTVAWHSLRIHAQWSDGARRRRTWPPSPRRSRASRRRCLAARLQECAHAARFITVVKSVHAQNASNHHETKFIRPDCAEQPWHAGQASFSEPLSLRRSQLHHHSTSELQVRQNEISRSIV